jgi:hypothetical protein
MSQAQKLLGVFMLLGAPFVAYGLATSFGGTTIQFICQPKRGQVQCELSENTRPSKKQIVTTIAKSELTGVKVLERRGSGKQGIVNQVLLTTTNQREIPLTEDWGGPATVQLLKRTDELEAFINDPQAQTLSLKTDRDYLSMALGLFIGASLAWSGLKALLLDDD